MVIVILLQPKYSSQLYKWQACRPVGWVPLSTDGWPQTMINVLGNRFELSAHRLLASPRPHTQLKHFFYVKTLLVLANKPFSKVEAVPKRKILKYKNSNWTINRGSRSRISPGAPFRPASAQLRRRARRCGRVQAVGGVQLLNDCMELAAGQQSEIVQIAQMQQEIPVQFHVPNVLAVDVDERFARERDSTVAADVVLHHKQVPQFEHRLFALVDVAELVDLSMRVGALPFGVVLALGVVIEIVGVRVWQRIGGAVIDTVVVLEF